MLDKIPDVSKLIVLATAVFYVCGFICVTSYLARFGFVNFDVVNARFLIAGIHATFALAICTATAWLLYIAIEGSSYIRDIKKHRFWFFVIAFGIPAGAAWVFRTLVSFPRYAPPLDKSKLEFEPLGAFDLVGNLLSIAWPFQNASETGFVVRFTLLWFIYILLALALVAAIIWLLGTVRSLAERWQFIRPRVAKTSAPTDAPQAATQATALAMQEEPVRPFALLLDLAGIVFALVLAWYSFTKLNTELFDVAGLQKGDALTYELTFAWFFSATFWMFIFLFFMDLKPAQLTLDFFAKNPVLATDLGPRALIPVVGALYFFGVAIYPKIPLAIGGGEPREVRLGMKDDDHAPSGRSFLVGESAQFLFVVQITEAGAKATQLNKDGVAWVETRSVAAPMQPPMPRPKPNPPTAASPLSDSEKNPPIGNEVAP